MRVGSLVCPQNRVEGAKWTPIDRLQTQQLACWNTRHKVLGSGSTYMPDHRQSSNSDQTGQCVLILNTYTVCVSQCVDQRVAPRAVVCLRSCRFDLLMQHMHEFSIQRCTCCLHVQYHRLPDFEPCNTGRYATVHSVFEKNIEVTTRIGKT